MLLTVMSASADQTPSPSANLPANIQMPLKGGLSPNGKYEIRVIGKDLGSYGYIFGFFKPNSKEVLFQTGLGGGFCCLQGASSIDSALWNNEEDLVAIQDHGTRHSMEIYILWIKNQSAESIPLPSFGAKVLKLMENIHGGGATACICTPLRWRGAKLLFRFDAGPNTSTVTVKITKSQPPRAEVISETPPEPIK